VDAIARGRGQPGDLVDLAEGLLTDGVDLDEELLDGAKDDGRLGPPAVRILVDVFFVAQDRALRGEDLDDAVVAGKDVLADEVGQTALGGVFALGIDRRKDVEPVLAASLVVVRAVSGSDVDRAGAGVVGCGRAFPSQKIRCCL